jgi:hypothetical protein
MQHKLEDRPYGFMVTFHGFMQGEDIARFSEDMKKRVNRMSGEFGVLVDLRETRTFPPDAQMALMEHIKWCIERGLNRNSVVVNSAITKIQASRLAKETASTNIRFIDAAQTDDPMAMAEDWLIRGIEPERIAS